jgi:glycosyltransferase involved in cell wall biosynthesis
LEEKRTNLFEQFAINFINETTYIISNDHIPNKISEEFHINKKDIVIGMTSRFGPDKGHEEFLEAARNIVELGYKNVKFLIVGDAVFDVDKKREEDIKKMTLDYNLSEKIIFTGFRNDIPNLLSLMDIFVLPAHKEPCGRVLFEAQAMEVAVVGTNSGGTPEIVEEGVTGFLFPPKNAKILTEKLKILIDDEKLRLKFGKSGRQRVKQLFPIKNNSDLTMNVYKKLLKRKGL